MKTSGILQGVRVAILVSADFEASELLESRRTLEHEDAATFLIAPAKYKVVGSNQRQEKKQVPIDIPLKSAKPEDFHALFLPGGCANAKHLAMNEKAVAFVKSFMEAGKPVAAIGEGTALLLETGALSGRTMTGSAFLQTNLSRAGAHYIDKDVVCEGNLITARRLDDLSAFDREMVRAFAELREHSLEMRKVL
jgi:protease I